MKIKDIKQTVIMEAYLYYRASTIPTICDPNSLALAINDAVRKEFRGVDKIKLQLIRVSQIPGDVDAILTLELPPHVKGNAKPLYEILLAALRADQSCMDPFTVQVRTEHKKLKKEGSVGKRLTDSLIDKMISSDTVALVDYRFIRQFCSSGQNDVVVMTEEHFPYQLKRYMEKYHMTATAIVAEIAHDKSKTLRFVFAIRLDDAVTQDVLAGGGFAVYES